MSMTPRFPSLGMPMVDSCCFDADPAIDEEAELTHLEKEHKQNQDEVINRDNDLTAAGQAGDERFEGGDDEEEEEQDDADGEDDSESNEEDDEDDVEDIEMS